MTGHGSVRVWPLHYHLILALDLVCTVEDSLSLPRAAMGYVSHHVTKLGIKSRSRYLDSGSHPPL